MSKNTSVESAETLEVSGVRKLDAEQVAAGWPSWLSAHVGEAIEDWLPRRADTFEKIDKIGQGTYSNVYKARGTITGKIIALKKVRFDNLLHYPALCDAFPPCQSAHESPTYLLLTNINF